MSAREVRVGMSAYWIDVVPETDGVTWTTKCGAKGTAASTRDAVLDARAFFLAKERAQ
jgi:hypothetical protein